MSLWEDIVNKNKASNPGYTGYNSEGNWVNQNQGNAYMTPDLGGSLVDISTMSNKELNDFALYNPKAMQNAGLEGYTVSTDNMKGLSADGADTSWFSENKDMLNAGLGLGQLGLGALNYSANKKSLESQLETQKQNRELQQARADNKTGIQNKFQSVWG